MLLLALTSLVLAPSAPAPAKRPQFRIAAVIGQPWAQAGPEIERVFPDDTRSISYPDSEEINSDTVWSAPNLPWCNVVIQPKAPFAYVIANIEKSRVAVISISFKASTNLDRALSLVGFTLTDLRSKKSEASGLQHLVIKGLPSQIEVTWSLGRAMTKSNQAQNTLSFSAREAF